MLDGAQKIEFSVPLDGRRAGHDNESWVFAIPVGRPVWDGRRMRNIDEGKAREWLANFHRANAFFAANAPEGSTRFYFPVKEDHKGARRFGDLLEGKLSGEGEKYGVYLKVQWTEETWEEIQASNRQHVSIGVKGKYELEDGTDVGPVPAELSLTEDPRIQSIGTIQDTLDLELSQSEEEELMEVQELLNSMNEQIMAQGEILAAMHDQMTASADDDEKDDDVEAATDDKDDDDGVEASQEDKEAAERIERIDRLEKSILEMSQSVKQLADVASGDSKSEGLPLNLDEKGSPGDPPKRETKEDFLASQADAGVKKSEALRAWYLKKTG